MQKYIDLLEVEINKLIEQEEKRGQINHGTEQVLHFLFENKKHVMELMENGMYHESRRVARRV